MAAVRGLRVSVKAEAPAGPALGLSSPADTGADLERGEPEPMEVEEGELEIVPVRRSLKELIPVGAGGWARRPGRGKCGRGEGRGLGSGGGVEELERKGVPRARKWGWRKWDEPESRDASPAPRRRPGRERAGVLEVRGLQWPGRSQLSVSGGAGVRVPVCTLYSGARGLSPGGLNLSPTAAAASVFWGAPGSLVPVQLFTVVSHPSVDPVPDPS